MLAKCCCNKDDRDRGLSSVRGTYFDLVDLTEKFNQVINHVRRHQCVFPETCGQLHLLQMYWRTMQPAQVELNSLKLAKVGEEKKKEPELN